MYPLKSKMKLKILALSYLFPNRIYPNYGIFVLNRLKAIQKYCDVKVINPIPWFPFSSCFDRYKNYNRIPKSDIIEGIEVFHPRFFFIPLYLKFLDAITCCLATIPVALKIREHFSFDLIDLHWVYPDILAAYVYRRICKKYFLVTIRGKEAVCFGEKSLRKKIINSLIKKADYTITLSQELKDIVTEIGVQEAKIKTIPNGVDIGRFKPLKRDECRKRLGLQLDKKILLSVGSLIITKGFHKIIKTLPDISKRCDLDLYIVGGVGPAGNYRKEIEDMIRKLNLNNVFLLDTKSNEELVYWYNACDVFCLATSTEGSPNVVMEALACGAPVVVSEVGGIPELVNDEFLGLLIDPDNSVDLTNKLEMALSIDWDRKRIRKYMEQLTWDWCAKQVITVYNEVLKH